jgi:hypothetical protein
MESRLPKPFVDREWLSAILLLMREGEHSSWNGEISNERRGLRCRFRLQRSKVAKFHKIASSMLLFSIGWPSPSTFAQTLKGGTLRVDVEMATVEVSVKDKQGRPVFDLKKQDFTLSEDGSPTEITAFDEVRDGEYSQPASVLSQTPASKIVLIVFDELSHSDIEGRSRGGL